MIDHISIFTPTKLWTSDTTNRYVLGAPQELSAYSVLPPCSTWIHCSIRCATMLDLQHPNFGPMIDHMYVLIPTKSWTSDHTYRCVPGSPGTLSIQYRNGLERPKMTSILREREREIPYSKGTLRASGPPYTRKGGMAANYEVGFGEGRLSNILDEVTAAP